MLLSDCALVKKKKNLEKYHAIWMDGWMDGCTVRQNYGWIDFYVNIKVSHGKLFYLVIIK